MPVSKPTMKTVKTAIEVILSDHAKYSTTLNYAIEYCRYAMTIEREHELKVQVLYILNNITGWRHSEAKAVRTILKGYK